MSPDLALMMTVLLACTALAACGERLGAGKMEPVTFLDAHAKFMGADMVEVTASAIHPTKGAVSAYADCVAARYALDRGKGFVSRVLTRPSANGDIEMERTTYLMSAARPGDRALLTAGDIIARCTAKNVPMR